MATHAAWCDQICVIVSQDNPVISMSQSEVKEIFLKKNVMTWKELGAPIYPLDCFHSQNQRTEFVRSIFNMSRIQYDRYWIKKLYASGVRPPERITDILKVSAIFEEHKGAIGLIRFSDLKLPLLNTVKIVFQINE